MKENCQRTNERGGKNCLGPLSLSLSLSLCLPLSKQTHAHTHSRDIESSLGRKKIHVDSAEKVRERGERERERERIPQRVFLSSKCVRKFGSNAIKWVWAVFLLLPGPFLSLLLARTLAPSDTHTHALLDTRTLRHTHSLSLRFFLI